MQLYITLFLATSLAAVGLVLTQHKHGHWSLDTAFGVQNHHTTPIPRIGGVAVMVGLLLGWFWASAPVRGVLGPMLLAAVPAFAFGLAEDVTKRVGVVARLLATMFSGFAAWYLTGVAMQDTGFAPLDRLLEFLPVAVVFTAFAVGGVANAVNIIDGFNGLAVGAVSIMLAALGLIAANFGDVAVAGTCFLLVSCTLGFGVVNWPLGKIFLGDGGAYLLGFLLAWLAVLLPMRHPQMNAWATVLVCAYPVIEVFYSVRRRRHREGHHPGQADKVHLHHLVHRRVVCQLFPGLSPELKNSLTSPVCWIFVAAPCVWAFAFAENTPMLIMGFGIAFVGYALLYSRLSQFRWCIRPATLALGVKRL